MNRELEQAREEAEQAWGTTSSERVSDAKDGIPESFERGGPGPLDLGDIVGVGSQSWWKKKPAKKISIMAHDKERPVATENGNAVVKTEEDLAVKTGEEKDNEALIKEVTNHMLENAGVRANGGS